MTNYFTPNEHQDLKNQKTQKRSLKQYNCSPSGFTMKVIFGYNAALQVIETKVVGKIEILNN